MTEEAAGPAGRTVGPNETMRLQALELDGQPHVAIFSSLSRLQQAISSVRPYVSMNGRDLALIHVPDSKVPPHIVVGIDQDGDWEPLVLDVVTVAREVECADGPVDFVQIGEGIAQYASYRRPGRSIGASCSDCFSVRRRHCRRGVQEVDARTSWTIGITRVVFF
jgi:hypothetical protein